MKLLVLIVLGVLSILAGTTQAAAPAERIVLPDSVVPSRYEIEIHPDKTTLQFSASAAIDLQVRSKTAAIILNAADLVFASVALSDRPAPATFSYDPAKQTATIAFATPIEPGRYRLTIEYAGKIYRSAAGMFALDYDTSAGRKRALFTQFENSDARRFVPCWDEPAQKAVFALTATVPEAEMAVSNMPIARTDRMDNGMKRIRFADTPRMSPYLLFFAAGDFERLSTTVNGTDVGVVVKRGDTANAKYALDATAHILPFYENYFGTKYPLPKLDLIAAPGSSQIFGAMENWGAILYFERRILIDPKTSTQGNFRDVYLTVAHETAHQWFGNLVTMSWWDDLWLNEGFASWMQVKATDHFHPEWKTWLDTLHDKEAAMKMDAKNGSHAVITVIPDVLQANQAFDTITYSKGAAVIRMLETFSGEEKFRDGIKRYIKAHAYRNTVSDDLWKEVEKTTPITEIAHDFTLQDGVPLVRATLTPAGVVLSEERFAVDSSGDKPQNWNIPIVAVPIPLGPEYRCILSSTTPVTLPEKFSGGLIVNAGQTGYFRTIYDRKLMDVVIGKYWDLSNEDQLGLLNDCVALGYAGLEPIYDFLRIARRMTPEQDPLILTEFIEKLSEIDFLLTGLSGRDRFQEFARNSVAPVIHRLGWESRPGESQNVTVLRSAALRALNQWNDLQIVTEAKIRFEKYLKNPEILSNDLLQDIIAMVAYRADAQTWESVHRLAKTAKTDVEKERLYTVLGSSADPVVARKALDLIQTDEVEITTRPWLLRRLSENHPDEVFTFVTAHIPQVKAMMETNGFYRAVPRMAARSFDPEMINRLSNFADENVPAAARKGYEIALSTIRYNIALRTKTMPEIERWLDQQPPAANSVPQNGAASATKP